MAKSKSITDLITQLQEENEEAKFLTKLFSQAIKHEYGYTADELHEIVLKYKALEKKFRQQEVARQGQQPTNQRS